MALLVLPKTTVQPGRLTPLTRHGVLSLPTTVLRMALPSPLRQLFDYLPPVDLDPALLHPGMRLRVPFGNRQLIGVLVELAQDSELPAERLKPALTLLDQGPALPGRLLEFCRWVARYYQHGLGDTLSWALPALLRQGEPANTEQPWYWQACPGASLDDRQLARAPRQQQALQILQQHSTGLPETLARKLGIIKDSLQALQSKGLAERQQRTSSHPGHQGSWLLSAELPLNDEQQAALAAIDASNGQFAAHLLAGVTGSGKTEVYLQLIHRSLKRGRQALVLIPEINLSPQTYQRFAARFNAHIVLLHSGLTDRERLNAWLAARDGHADIIIGTRSAIFTPLQRPGLIIVDEEHDPSYKQQEGLRYHARDLALVRAQSEQVPVLLGSATPSLESLHNADQGRYQLHRLRRRAGNAKPPTYQRLGVKSLPLDAGLSAPLCQAIEETLNAGQQVLLFLNRRGFAPTLLCHDCGWVAECPSCDARLVLHQGQGQLLCHHCGYLEPRPRRCPHCGKLDLRPLGAGTERTEERLNILFPDYPVLRIDRDSTVRKQAMADLISTIARGESCILLGTQMLAKGHHFPAVTLAAILNADAGLFSTDFRASERMAQQIVQVAGRAGRADAPGRVIVQSHHADHPLLVQLTEQGYEAFAKAALAERQAASLPPFSFLALLRAEASHLQQAEAFLQQAQQMAEPLCQGELAEIMLLGPVPAPMERRAGRFRAQLLVQANDRGHLHRLLGPWLVAIEQLPTARRLRWSLDVDPVDLY